MKIILPYFLIVSFVLVIFEQTKGADEWVPSDPNKTSLLLSSQPAAVARQSNVKASAQSATRPYPKPTISRGAPATGIKETAPLDELEPWREGARRMQERKELQEGERKEQTKRLLRKSPSDTNLKELKSTGFKRDAFVPASKSDQNIDPIVSFRKWNLVYGVPDTVTQQTYKFFQGVKVYRTYDSGTSCINTKFFRFGPPKKTNAPELVAWSGRVVKSRDEYSRVKGFMNQKKQLLDQQKAKYESEQAKYVALCGEELSRNLIEVDATIRAINTSADDADSTLSPYQPKTEAFLEEKAKQAFEKAKLDFTAVEATFKQTEQDFLKAESDFRNEQRKHLLKHAVKGQVYKLTNSRTKVVKGDKEKIPLTPKQLITPASK